MFDLFDIFNWVTVTSGGCTNILLLQLTRAAVGWVAESRDFLTWAGLARMRRQNRATNLPQTNASSTSSLQSGVQRRPFTALAHLITTPHAQWRHDTMLDRSSAQSQESNRIARRTKSYRTPHRIAYRIKSSRNPRRRRMIDNCLALLQFSQTRIISFANYTINPSSRKESEGLYRMLSVGNLSIQFYQLLTIPCARFPCRDWAHVFDSVKIALGGQTKSMLRRRVSRKWIFIDDSNTPNLNTKQAKFLMKCPHRENGLIKGVLCFLRVRFREFATWKM